TGGSSTANGIENLEMSTISGGSTQQFSTGGLINVPDHLRKLDEQAFTPLLISIGPIHHSNVKLQTMKKYKELGYFNEKIEHFTDLVRLFYLSEQLPDRRSGVAKLSYSATQLQEAGVKFKGVEFDENMRRYRGNRRFLDIRFDLKNGLLEIPCIALNDEKIRLIRNIIALEQSLYVGHAYVTDFFVILNFLIKTSKDVDLLCDKGILVYYLGDSNVAASAINNLNTKILGDYMNKEYLKICEDLNASYEQLWYGWRAPWHRWRETLWRQYFSTPWRAASTSGAIILLGLTTIQTDYMNSDYSKICKDLNAFYKKPWHRWRATLWRQYFSTPWKAASTCAAIIFLLRTAIQTVCSLKSTKW
ncbi:hypothetical protein CFP56_002490, partial [Quercus suber]